MSVLTSDILMSGIYPNYGDLITFHNSLSNGLAGYWKEENNNLDSSGNGKHLTRANGSDHWNTGKNNIGAEFVTASDDTTAWAIYSLRNTSFSGTSTDITNINGYTVSFWIKQKYQPRWPETIFAIHKLGERYCWFQYTGSHITSNFTIDVGLGLGTSTDSFSTTLSTGWTHLCIVMQPTTGNYQWYQDGVLKSNVTNATSGNWHNAANPYNNYIVFGGDPANNASSVTGWMDEMAIWNRPLNVNEVSALYNNGIGTFL